MIDPFKGIEKRLYRRLILSLPIKLLNQKVESKNISSTGVYFEVITDDIDQFQIGKSLGFELLAKTSSPMLPSRTIRLSGSGKIIRNDVLSSSQHKKKLGIALRFNKKLEILLDAGKIQ